MKTMKKMKKTMLGVLLALCMIVTLCPVLRVSAKEGDTFNANVTVGGNTVSAEFEILTEPASGNPGTVKYVLHRNVQLAAGELIIPSTVSNSGNTYTVTTIGQSAFNSCSGLTSVSLPQTIIKFDSMSSLLAGSPLLTSINVDPANESYCSEDGIVYNKDKTSIIIYPFAKSGTSFQVPDTVTSIGSGAFGGCRGLSKITLPSGVTSIGDYAFSSCRGLSEITLPSGVTSIGDHAFSECSGLTEITLPSGVTSIGDEMFSGCSNLTKITLPSGVTSIGNGMFYGCSKLTEITLPSGVTSIGQGAFQRCSKLTEITLPSGVTSIGSGAFWGCSGISEITLPSGVNSIGASTFRECAALDSIIFQSTTAPNIDADGIFTNTPENLKLYVPADGTGYTDGGASANWQAMASKIQKYYAITGTIKGSDTNSGIPATLQLKDSTGANVGSTVTANADGTYVITPILTAGTYQLAVSYAGYGSGIISNITVSDANVTGKNLTLLKTAGTITKPDASIGSGAPAAVLNNDIEDLKNKVLTAEEKTRIQNGADANIYLEVKDAQATVSDAEKNKVTASLGDNVLGSYLDITLYKKIGNDTPVKVTDPSGKISITIKVPDNLINTDATKTRTYKLVSMHNGEPVIIEGTYNSQTHEFTFETDGFSTYALVYADKSTSTTPVTTTTAAQTATVTTTSPKTGDNSLIMTFLMLAMVSGAGCVYCWKKRKTVR